MIQIVKKVLVVKATLQTQPAAGSQWPNEVASDYRRLQLAGTLYREANWLVADHLSTPRMIANKS